MKQNTSFLKRFFALAMALLIAVSGSNLGVALQVSAAGSDIEVNIGKLVADNYELSDAEKALLSSGYLAGDTISYTVPTNEDGLVTVDTENKTITAETTDKGWYPTVARIMVGTELKETVTLVDGVGAYTYGENAFSVEVDYSLDEYAVEFIQEDLLNTPAWLKSGIANTDAVSAQGGNLYILEQAMPELVKFATEGVETGTVFGKVSLNEAGRNAVNALNDQMTANGGKLNLSLMIEDYDSGSRSEYLLKNGAAMKAEIVAMVGYLDSIAIALNSVADFLDGMLENGWIDETTASQLNTLIGVVNNLKTAMDEINAGDWTAAEKGLALVSDAVNFVALDALVKALGDLTPMPELKEKLHVADTTLTVNMSMFNVTVEVALVLVEDKADSNELVEHADVKTVVLTLAEGATTEEILAAVAENGIVAAAKAFWGDLYVAEHFNENPSALPETLTEDITYEVNFVPKTYTITGDLGEKEVYYGYQLTLPAHEDETKAFDYTVNGEKFAQGEVVTIVGNTEVLRTSGKAYVGYDLYKIVSENYGNAVAQAILKSGALKDNVTINVREPDPLVDTNLVTLVDGVVTANNYNAAYMGLSWVPSTYGLEGTENAFSGNSADWDGKSVKVLYMLVLSNFSVEKSAEVLQLAADLKAEADAQKDTLDRLAAYHSTMGQLDKTKLGALNGVIDVTDFTPGDGTDADAKNLELRAYFKSMVGGIIANNLDSNNLLKIYNILSLYLDENSGGLRYYYENSETVINEINVLSGYLSGLLADEEKVAALEIMVGAAGYPEYAENIKDLERIMTEVKEALTAPNSMIDLTSPNLGKLITALEADGEVAIVGEVGHPYLISKAMTGMDESQVNVQVAVWLGETRETFTSASFDRGYVLTAADVADLNAKLNAAVAKLMGDNARFYTFTVEGTPIDELVGVELDKQLSITYTYTAKNFTVKIAGEADQIITIDNLEISLPKHPDAGWVYRYTIDGVSGITSTSYTFKPAQLDSLFVDGVYEITRVAADTVAEGLESAFAEWAVRDENGKIVALNAQIDANKDGIMKFVDVLQKAGYTYIGLNGEGLMYMNDEDTLEVSLQTLINAMLKDNSFGSQTLIALGKNGGGKLLTAEMQLGNSKEDAVSIPFTLTLKSVPGAMATVANGLDAVKNYMSFQSKDGILDVKLNLPEKIYEVYLTALLATGNVDKYDITAVNNEIAFMFLYDYLEIITDTDATTQSYTNTLAKLNINKDLTGYEDYYQMLKKALSADGLVVNSVEGDGIFDISVTAASKPAIDKLIALAGIDTSGEIGLALAMIKEYKDGNTLSVTVIPSLTNAGTAFEAVVIDVNAIKDGVQGLTGRNAAPRAAASTKGAADTIVGLIKGEGVANGFDYTGDLIERAKSITGQAAIMLLGDVDGDLVFNGTTILDLNGYTINGNVVSNGSLYIVDSSMETANCGWITGNVSGNVKIIAGNYNVDVTAYLPEGYKQVGTSVQNALYIIEADANGNITFVVNSDVIDEDGFNVKYLAVDIAVDVALNYFTAAALTADGIDIYNINIDDLIDLIDSTTKVDDLINKGLGSVNVPGISDFINVILADLIDFAAIESAIANDEALATYTLTTAPWTVAVEHKTAGDYITFGITSNPDLAKEFTMSIKLGGDNKAYAQKLAGALADIVVKDGTFITIDLLQPVYADKTITASGSAEAAAEIDLTVDKNYTTVVAVVLAYGNPEQAADLAKYVNSGNMAKLKEVIDNMTVEDVFDALKACNRATSFTAMAQSVGVTIDVTAAAELEEVFHLIICGAGKVLEKLEITGRDSKLGNLDKDNDGTYEFSATVKNKSADVSARGYAVEANITEVSVSLTVHLFGNNCIVGDVNHDGKINTGDIVELRKILSIADYDIICEYCADVNQDGKINTGDLVELRKILTTAP